MPNMKGLMDLGLAAGGGYAAGMVRAKRPKVAGVDTDLGLGLALGGAAVMGAVKGKTGAALTKVASGALAAYAARQASARESGVSGFVEIGASDAPLMLAEPGFAEIGYGYEDDDVEYELAGHDYGYANTEIGEEYDEDDIVEVVED